MVDDTHDLMSSSWPHACLPDGTMPSSHSKLVFFFSLFTLTLKFMLFVKCAFCHHSVRISYQLNIIDTMPLGLYLTFAAISQIFYQKLDSISFFSFFLSKSTLRWWRRGTCAEIFHYWTTACLTKVHYLSSKMDELELLNTTRSDISCTSAIFL